MMKEEKQKLFNKELKTSFKVDGDSVYVCQVNIYNTELYNSLQLIASSNSGKKIFKRDITGDGPLKTVFFTEKNDSIVNFSVVLKSRNVGVHLAEVIYSLDVFRVGMQRSDKLKTVDNSICVSIATYPARKKSLMDTIESLIGQVDYLLLYLNEYTCIPDEISNHELREKIVCIIDEDGARRAEGKFHWMHRIDGFYFTCDDDIIYPADYISKTIQAIELSGRKAVVGYHGVIFNDSVASFKGDRKFFYKFTEELRENKKCHLLGTGVLAFHTEIFNMVDTHLLHKYPFAVDPAFAVICKSNNIDMLCIGHDENWLRSSPYMNYGLHEEKQAFPEKKKAVDQLLQKNNPWGGGFCSVLIARIKRHPKLRKLINNPMGFIRDSTFLRLFH
ncbi:TPA: hypothetical protein ACSP2B_002763 [Aeromonas veronii]|uniref:hypothetical protein n=1 Tax=Aeromonas veronii TaxID=654 RepID=UPI003CF3D32E